MAPSTKLSKSMHLLQVTSKYELLFGRESDRIPLSNRKKIWQSICVKVNALGIKKRTPTDLQRKWYDCRRQVKDKLAKIHLHSKQTGGGPPTRKKLSDVEQLLADTFEKEHIEGIGNYDAMAGFEVDSNNSQYESMFLQTPNSRDDPENFQEANNEGLQQTLDGSQNFSEPCEDLQQLPGLVKSYMAKNDVNFKAFLSSQSSLANLIENGFAKVGSEMSLLTQAILNLNSNVAKIADSMIKPHLTTSTCTSPIKFPHSIVSTIPLSPDLKSNDLKEPYPVQSPRPILLESTPVIGRDSDSPVEVIETVSPKPPPPKKT
ncbi:t-SNARE domain-containing protein 1-like isoform X1 [Hyla sarda]|uniref:t-SNARE domain-containing protein 1-like isoform X1 n=1 Tax=Hyla sarda TaxID=327740 RepID=UPI0024C30FA7|nr:t-SNARE domain-containing protein 1-like isoform X1 [Hyla sarda]